MDNPDGSTGITLHLIYDKEVPASTVNVSRFNQTLQTLYSDHFDHRTYGYRYAVIGSEVVWKGDDWYNGVAYYEHNAFTAECESSEEPGHSFMHELGHSLGLSLGDDPGIDSFQFRPDTYSSIMNYNTSGDLYRFSTGDASPNDFDDWGHIEQHMIPPDTGVSSQRMGNDTDTSPRLVSHASVSNHRKRLASQRQTT